MKKKTSQLQDKYVLRLPDGLRGRIKAYAERQGRSMNAEIVRVLEKEFPEAWPFEDRMSQLLDMVEVLKAGGSSKAVEKLAHELEETIEGIQTKRVRGLTDAQRYQILQADIERHEKIQDEAVDRHYGNFDEEEFKMFAETGRTEKYTHSDEDSSGNRQETKKALTSDPFDDDAPF